MEFSELFTQSAREVLSLARIKKLVSYFDYHGPLIDLPRGDAALRSGIHRVLLGLIECLDTGFVTFSADVGPSTGGFSKVLVHAAGTGGKDPIEVQNVLRRLQLRPAPRVEPDSHGNTSRAEGTCPATGGKVVFVDAGADGLLISLEIQLAAVERLAAEPLPHAAGVKAWLVSEIPGGLDSVGRRLRRLGWHVQSFKSLKEVCALMDSAQGGDPSPGPPLLLMVAESTGHDLPEIQRIAVASPALRTVLGVVAGSPTVTLRGHTLVDIRVLPLSPLELDNFTAHVDWRTSTVGSGETAPPPLYVQDRRLILVVDDNAVNQTLADAMLGVLGYDVAVVGNGVEALDICRRDPPDLVMMDIDMPVMGGLEATQRLRAWQRVGTLPPFPIVAATSGHDEFPKEVCLAAGMDGYIAKPLNLQILADELHRVLPTRPLDSLDDKASRPAK